MLPIGFAEANFTFKKPESMSDEQCSSLPVWKGVDGGGLPIIISCWQFSVEDLREIAKNNRIYLQIVGNGMPPVDVFTENPFEINGERQKAFGDLVPDKYEKHEDLCRRIFSDIGTASVQWSQIANAGAFDTRASCAIAANLCDFIINYFENKQNENTNGSK